jgi:hypothetical protein
MRLHEYYFEQFEEGGHAMSAESGLAKAASEKYGSGEGIILENIDHFRELLLDSEDEISQY